MDLAKHAALSAYVVPICVAATLVWLVTFWLAIRQALLIYYRTHRTLHNCGPLYDSIHSIHHRGILPTPLDAGTTYTLTVRIQGEMRIDWFEIYR